MNQRDRKRLVRLRELLTVVPFPKSGGWGGTASIDGFAAYQNDMRNLLPAVGKILDG
ncbi:MAG: hypothetical protein ABIG63_11380 [Chloroflexota bacterium]